jgi:hypothetical protein
LNSPPPPFSFLPSIPGIVLADIIFAFTFHDVIFPVGVIHGPRNQEVEWGSLHTHNSLGELLPSFLFNFRFCESGGTHPSPGDTMKVPLNFKLLLLSDHFISKRTWSFSYQKI